MFPLALSVICLTLQTLESRSVNWFEFRAQAIFAGEWWRMLTGNFVHLGFSHVFLNLAGMWFIYFLFQVLRSTHLAAWTFLTSAMVVSSGLLWISTEVDWYVGLSGILHGLFVAAVLADYHRHSRESLVLLSAIILKLGYEQFFGSVPGSSWASQGNVIVDAHLYGAVGGLPPGLVYLVRRRPERPVPTGATRY